MEQAALELVSQGSDHSLCHPGADFTELQTPQKPRQGGKSDKMLGCVCFVLLLVRFSWGSSRRT